MANSLSCQEKLRHSLGEIEALIKTPHLIIDTAVHYINEEKKQYHQKITQDLDRLITLLTNISSSTLEKEFSIIYNQICVLAVSALSASLQEHFCSLIDERVSKVEVAKEKLTIKIPLGDIIRQLKDKDDGSISLSRLIIQNDSNAKFQNYDLITKAYSDYLQINLNPMEEIKNKVTFYLQCRNVIAHCDSKIDQSFVKNTSSCNLKSYNLGDEIKLEKDDWEMMKKSFLDFAELVDQESRIHTT